MECLVQRVRKAKRCCMKNTQTRNPLLGEVDTIEQKKKEDVQNIHRMPGFGKALDNF